MVVFVTCKNEEDPIKLKALEWSQHYSLILRHSRATNSEVSGGILPKFKLILTFMVCLVTFKNEEASIKNEGYEWLQNFADYNPMGATCCNGNQSSDPI